MRARTVVSIALLLLPAASEAQRLPQPRGGSQPGQPVPIGKQPEPIARAQEFQRLRVSFESYPMASYFHAPGFPGASQRTSWTAAGAGARMEYRLTSRAAATLDLTSSLDGSPMRVETLELGGRLRRAQSESRLTPYADARVGVTWSQSASGTLVSGGGVVPTNLYSGASSYGFGAVAGAGLEYALSSTWTVTTGASLMQSQLTATAIDYSGQTANFGMTSYRVSLGIRYTPVRSMVMKQER